MGIDMHVWVVLIRSKDDEDGVYAFTSREKARQFIIDTIVQRHEEADIPSIVTEGVVQQAEEDLRSAESFFDLRFSPTQCYYISCAKVS